MGRCKLFIIFFCAIKLEIIQRTQSDFLYPDFESTIGIDFNGAAATSSCDEGKRLRYQPRHGTADQNIEVPPSTSEEGTDQVQFQEVKMDTTKSEASTVTADTAILGHREKMGQLFLHWLSCSLAVDSIGTSKISVGMAL